MKIIKTPFNRVVDIQFDKPLKHFETHYATSYKDPVSHKDVALLLKDKKLFSVIIFSEMLHKDLWENPDYCKRETTIYCNSLTAEVRTKMQNKWPMIDTVKEKLKKLAEEDGLELSVGNHHDDTDQYKHDSALEDAYYAGLEDLEKCNLLNEYREGCRWFYDEETGEEREATPEEQEKEWEETKEMLLSPRTRQSYDRVYALPKCLARWDSRNNFQQYFFIENEDSFESAQGGYGSSGSRFDLGLMIHTFAHLHHQGKEIPTYIMIYNQYNELHLVKDSPTFLCLSPSFGCNYNNYDREEREIETKGIIVNRHEFVVDEWDKEDVNEDVNEDSEEGDKEA
jgi:rubredoxin